MRVTFATATGFALAVLTFHFAMGLIAIVTGAVAMAARKGGTWHRKSGVVFSYAMILLGITATGIALSEGKPGWASGLLASYLVLTAYTTVRPLPPITRRVDIGLMLLALAIAVSEYRLGIIALGLPGKEIGDAPAGMIFFLSTVTLLAVIGDFRMIRAGGIQGARRLARHVWRMCFGLFIASGSFFLGQMRFIPKPIRIVPLIYVLAVGPLMLLLYWLWRVRLRKNLRGLMTVKPIGA